MSAPRISVVGIGGGGRAALERMRRGGIDGVTLIGVDTDASAAGSSPAGRGALLTIGTRVCRGRGANADPALGRRAAMSDRTRLGERLAGSELVVLVAGMGGGTGTGATPVAASVAREAGATVIALVTEPPALEGERRVHVAAAGIEALRAEVPSPIVLPGGALLADQGSGRRSGSAAAAVERRREGAPFDALDEALWHAVRGITDLVTTPDPTGLDIVALRAVMALPGLGLIGVGRATGRSGGRGRRAVRAAFASPSFDELDPREARGLLVGIVGGADACVGDCREVGDAVRLHAAPDARVASGFVCDESLIDELRVIVVASGLESWFERVADADASASNGDGRVADVIDLDSRRPTATR